MVKFLTEAKRCSSIIATMTSKRKSDILVQMADALIQNSQKIIAANKKDLEQAKSMELSSAMLERLLLDEKRVAAMATSLREIAQLKEPVGRVLEGWINEDNLRIEKVSVPIGVVAVIYESRPNVTSDVGALCFKSG